MLIYQATKAEFLDDAFKRDIEEVIAASYLMRRGYGVGKGEFRSWRESLMSMAKVLNDDEIPATSGVAIEYGIPQTSMRVDFILTGHGDQRVPQVVIVELKQWTDASATKKDGIVETFVGGRRREVSHPSYQAWSYAALLEGFSEAVEEGGMRLQPCAYLHNYEPDAVISHDCYGYYLEKAPVFLKGEAERAKLRAFIKAFVKHGDDASLLYRIENGRIRPSKMLADSLVSMWKGNQEFVLIDDQKVVYETARALASRASAGKKVVYIVEGGPGTGKSVVAINLLVEFTRRGLLTRYVSKNAAPRSVYENKLTGLLRKSQISSLFGGSGAFTETDRNAFDALIVDEAHRLNEKSGLYGNLGDNQIKELIVAAKCCIFFVDEDQRVTLVDIGRKSEIAEWAKRLGAEVVHGELPSQFRCNGSDGYLAWLDDALQVRRTANEVLDTATFDFQVFDSPEVLRQVIVEKNRLANRARLVAGYCWPWNSKRDDSAQDVVIPEHGFAMQWNLTTDGSLWIVAPESVEQIGCIHTCQGLEVDYIGVVVGPDLIVRGGEVITKPEARASSDRSVRGYKRLLKDDPEGGAKRLDEIIKNTYRTLMTRGLKGCYVYFTDKEAGDYFRARLGAPQKAADVVRSVTSLPRRRRFVHELPLVPLKVAAGAFGEPQAIETGEFERVRVNTDRPARPGLFVAQVLGRSMEPDIPDGAYCLFQAPVTGSRQGRIVLVELRDQVDPETGERYTVKRYESEVVGSGDSWRHGSITLHPANPEFEAIVLGPADEERLRVVAELVEVLDGRPEVC